MAEQKSDPKGVDMFNVIVANARQTIFNPRGVDMVLQKIQSADDPALGIGHTAAMVMRSVSSGIEKKGRVVPPPVLFGAFKETVGDLTEVAAAAKVIPDEEGAKKSIAQKSLLEGVKVFKAPAQGQQPPQQPPGGQPQAQPPQAQQPPGAPAAPPPGAVDSLINKAMGAL